MYMLMLPLRDLVACTHDLGTSANQTPIRQQPFKYSNAILIELLTNAPIFHMVLHIKGIRKLDE